VNLIVPRNPEAVSEFSLDTDPMTELVFGAENSPKPIPIVVSRSNIESFEMG